MRALRAELSDFPGCKQIEISCEDFVPAAGAPAPGVFEFAGHPGEVPQTVCGPQALQIHAAAVVFPEPIVLSY